MVLIIVESPKKAKAIGEYLKGEKENYKVLSTYGHIRTLDSKAGSINTQKEYEFRWQGTPQWQKNKTELIKAAKESNKIILATDLDREGEGIAWHFLEELKAKKINKPTERITFDSISKKAILAALEERKELRMGLVESYLARTGLDYLFGYSISPLLWHKVPCCKSAGRTQSATLRIIVERENEILNFESQKYHTIEANFKEAQESALLTQFNGEKFENGQIFHNKPDIKKLQESKFHVNEIKQTQSQQKPPAPFITSSLLQAASSQLNLSPNITMQLAQKLYEGFTVNGQHTGLITYMRTDSTTINPDFIKQIRKTIEKKYGKEYLPTKANSYKAEKNAQEAHEAIRCVDINIQNVDLGDKNLERLYKLIWARTVASQMNNAIIESTTISIVGNNNDDTSLWAIKTSKTLFKGFKVLFMNEEDEIKESHAPNLKQEQNLTCKTVEEKEHETQAPKRYSEASLIAQLKKKGIGRPSTYSRNVQILYEREYAKKEKKIIVPTNKGWIVTGFMKHFFANEIEYEFTAKMENELDEIKNTGKSHKAMLENFWKNLENKIENIKTKNPIETGIGVQKEFSKYFMAQISECQKCGSKMLLKFSKFGAMLGCENYPQCKEVVNIGQAPKQEAEMLGEIDGNAVELKIGPYGPYIEIKNEKPQRIPVPKMWQKSLEDITIEHAKFLANLPKELGTYENEKITLGIGKFGPFIKFKNKFYSIKGEIMQISLNDAVALINSK